VTPVDRKPRDSGQVRLAIVTQPTLLRDVLSRLLRHEPNFELVGQGHDEDHIVKVIKETTPDLLLFDYEALGPNSESIIGRLRRLAPRMRILVIATRSADENVERVLRAGAAEPEGQLTKREQQIVDGVARGLRNKEIAHQLDISEKTVKSHLNNIFQKLGLEGRLALAMFDQSQIQPKT
jgi:DNA-binding NarL/FixJ family response regulator